ncbi:MAG: tetratricopeptide repeat protein [Proteobacteria bacterium]|nr:tetratricopeptide repeat protein [Pseudomonadota bacterium]
MIKSTLMPLLIFVFLVGVAGCNTNDSSLIFKEALNLVDEKKYDEAIQNLIALTKAYPNDPLADDSLFWIANIYEHYLKDHQQSIRFYRTLNKRFESSEYYFQSMAGLARVYASQGDNEKRKALLIHQKLKKNNLINGEKEKNQYQLAQLYFDLKMYEKSRAELKNLILNTRIKSYIPKAYHLIGFSYYVEGNKSLAEITFKEADKKFLQSRVSLASAISLADIYEESDHLQSAIEVYRSILGRLEKKEVFYQLAKDRIVKLRSRLKKTNKS